MKRESGADAEGPLIGASLRACWQSVRDRIATDLSERGFADIGAAHLAVLQWPSPRGVRVTSLASRSRISRQAMNYLIRELEGMGYLERRRDPSDGRARLVHLTERGEAAIRSIRASVRRLEQEWERELGPRRFAQLRSALTDLSSRSR
jgi:DNA-binding MarR family transcriptional regulator